VVSAWCAWSVDEDWHVWVTALYHYKNRNYACT